MSLPPDVLVVEDNPADVELMLITLEEFALPHRLHFVPDGEAALTYLRGTLPRLLLLDLNLPRVSGLEVLEALRREGLPVPVVVFTSSAAQQDQQDALSRGAAAHVVKPMSFGAFSQMFADLLRTHAPMPRTGWQEGLAGS
ncbi:MAG: response regulator receiver protein [Deinococcus sp.]|nr:response regulator receiver protein [Deinococcus sp.]